MAWKLLISQSFKTCLAYKPVIFSQPFKTRPLQKLRAPARITAAGERVIKQGLGDRFQDLWSAAGRKRLIAYYFPNGGPVPESDDFLSSDSESD